MQIRFLIPALLVTFLITACSVPPLAPANQNVPTAPASQLEPVEPVQDATPEVETIHPDCLNGAVSPIGQAIAQEYESTSYDQIITWFCSGAEFEDILVALETESQTGTPAEEMLQMLADGSNWEEIWQMIGLTE